MSAYTESTPPNTEEEVNLPQNRDIGRKTRTDLAIKIGLIAGLIAGAAATYYTLYTLLD